VAGVIKGSITGNLLQISWIFKMGMRVKIKATKKRFHGFSLV
jgi:uncharacterized protein YxjI